MLDIEVAFSEESGGLAVVFCVPCDIHLCIYDSLDVCLVQARDNINHKNLDLLRQGEQRLERIP
jgi:hypothetical protein